MVLSQIAMHRSGDCCIAMPERKDGDGNGGAGGPMEFPNGWGYPKSSSRHGWPFRETVLGVPPFWETSIFVYIYMWVLCIYNLQVLPGPYPTRKLAIGIPPWAGRRFRNGCQVVRNAMAESGAQGDSHDIFCWILVGHWWFGTMEFYGFSYWECHNHPNWRTHIFQRGWNHQPGYIHIWFMALYWDVIR